MAYGLSFTEDFYVGHGEYDSGELQLNSKGQPVTLYSAVRLLLETPSRERARLCASMRASLDSINAMDVVERAREIDTCDSIGRNGVPVYITPFDNGWGLTVTVYEQDRDSEAAQ